MSNVEVIQNRPLTFTVDEEVEIANRLRLAQNCLRARTVGYRKDVIHEITAVNRVIRTALNRGIPEDPTANPRLI